MSDIEAIKRKLREAAKVATSTPENTAAYLSICARHMPALLADHDLKVKQLEAAMRVVIAADRNYSTFYEELDRLHEDHPELFPAESAETGGGE